ncbi:hypothetical protein [Shouchella lonarensis]|uniref:Uncharacterized protein n=1 Tax=Shouchella lonarensis TaxID=1464122 RepID=A0A1G6GK86_9BACI|nr:hypothetical protein [Shouchella lonarensis]SDB82360.1 hypothetical protein SAMN05421737_101174 [Shouchella lonarensis]
MKNVVYGSSFRKPPGYKIVFGEGEEKHYFGGDSWDLPECPICRTCMHQIITLDLGDNRLTDLREVGGNEIALFSCLNCSMCWADQFFKIDFKNRRAIIIRQCQQDKEQMEEEYRMTTPLPCIPVSLVGLKKEEYPTSEEKNDNIFSELGTTYIGRVLGKPVLAQEALNNRCCECKKEMKFVALVTGENGIEEMEEREVDLFFGEFILYFSLCITCSVMKVESQSI